MGVSPVISKAIQIFAFVTEEELKGDSPALTIYNEQFAVMPQKLPLDFRSGVKQGAGHRHRGSSPRPFRISLKGGSAVFGWARPLEATNKRQFKTGKCRRPNCLGIQIVC